MRVISGTAKGIHLKAVPGMSTRPTTDKVKEAIFSMIGPYFLGGNVLDLFAGTGALGIESLSRGMAKAIFIDQDRKSIHTIQQNLTLTRMTDQAEVYHNDALRALKTLRNRQITFDLIFLDPPYRFKQMEEIMEKILAYQLFSNEAFVVAEHDASYVLATSFAGLEQVRKAIYGDSAITIYQYRSNLKGENHHES
jgi:16S rRNA (guanine966-N2)-methyltransferase